MKIWGLTGGIASGKSTVAKILKENGFEIIDADEVTRSVRQDPSTKERLEKEFGTSDPQKLRTQIFSDPNAKSKLESILHPLIRERSQKMFEDMRNKIPRAKGIIYEASLIFKAGRQDDFDGIIFVKAANDKRSQWLKKRDQVSQQNVDRAFDSEDPTPNKESMSTFVLENDGDLNALKAKVLAIIPKLS